MRRLLAILLTCHLLILSGMASAHIAVDAHDPHEAVHVHLGDDHHASSGDDSDHDNGHHVHLCVLALDGSSAGSSAKPAAQIASEPLSLTSWTLTPPVPPPNA